MAASAVALGARASIIELALRLMTRGVPEPLAARLADRHRNAGVALHLGRRIAAMAAVDDALRLTLDDGTVVAADHLLVAIGASPRTELAVAAGLTVDGGIIVDEHLRTSDPATFAAGDCTAFPDPLTGDLIGRESRHNAELQGPLAARNMLGAGEVLAPVPWFWSDQHEQTLQIAGTPEAGTRTVERATAHGLLLFHLATDDRLVGVSALGPAALAKEFKVAQRLVEAGRRVEPRILADPATRLKALLR
ncbi:MAG: FAD-dependent oxidoreductase [Geminicoccaceae bacterium]|nr:FAD-dependent oxidoreductase [Geminicoccaceae bacterium]